MAKTNSTKIQLNSKKCHGLHSKSQSSNPNSKMYKKSYRGQGR